MLEFLQSIEADLWNENKNLTSASSESWKETRKMARPEKHCEKKIAENTPNLEEKEMYRFKKQSKPSTG